MLIVVWTSGTSTMLPLILSCTTLGACMSFSNDSQGASSLHSNSFRYKKRLVSVETACHWLQHKVELYS